MTKKLYAVLHGWEAPQGNAALPSEPPVCSSEFVGLPACDICKQPQTQLGALKFGVPRTIKGLSGVWCQKLHVCVNCDRQSNND